MINYRDRKIGLIRRNPRDDGQDGVSVRRIGRYKSYARLHLHSVNDCRRRPSAHFSAARTTAIVRRLPTVQTRTMINSFIRSYAKNLVE